MGSDENRDARYIKARVSIHAPAWGATGDSIFCERFKLVSIHAPAWGATVVLQGFRADKKFQSTLPHGERRSPLPWLPPRYWFQSTLPHGERHMGFGRLNTMYMFQSTLPHGERPASLPRVIIPDPFQSTLPHGERPRIRGRKQLEQDSFNPRSRMGSDQQPGGYRYNGRGFNPRSRMGSDRNSLSSCFRLISFNPRSRMGSDFLPRAGLPYFLMVSIHAPAWGATGFAWCRRHRWRRFNPRSRMGSDTAAIRIRSKDQKFQSTLPHGERPG